MTKRPIGKRLFEHRRLVLDIMYKTSLITALREKLYQAHSGSVIEPAGADPDTLIGTIQMIADLTAELDALEETRRMEQVEFDPMIGRLESELQRQVLEAYYFYGLSWREVAEVIYSRSHEAQKRSCINARGRAIRALIAQNARKR